MKTCATCIREEKTRNAVVYDGTKATKVKHSRLMSHRTVGITVIYWPDSASVLLIFMIKGQLWLKYLRSGSTDLKRCYFMSAGRNFITTQLKQTEMYARTDSFIIKENIMTTPDQIQLVDVRSQDGTWLSEMRKQLTSQMHTGDVASVRLSLFLSLL